MALEIPWGLGTLGFLRHLWFLVDPLGLWTLEIPMSQEVPSCLGTLGFLVCLRHLCLQVDPWILEGRVIPQHLLVPRVQGSLGYLGFLARKNKHRNHKVHTGTSVECPKCGK